MISQTTHKRFLDDLDHICAVANVPKSMVFKSAKDFCAKTEIDWLLNFPRYEREGKNLCLVGMHSPSPETKMMAMACTLLRNHLDARVLPLNTVLHLIADGFPPDPHILLIPNLYIRQGGKTLPSWQMQQVYDLLLARLVAGKPTIIYVEDMNALGMEYGSVLSQHIKDHYITSQP